MKNRKLMTAALAVVGAMAMCSAALAQTTTSTTTTTTTDQTSMANMDVNNRLSISDQIFLMNLIHANALEIEMGQLAAKRLSDFASKMVSEHTNGQTQILNTFGNQPWVTDWQHTLRRTSMPSSGYSYYYSNNYMSSMSNNMNQTASPGQAGTMNNSGSTNQGTNNTTAQSPNMNGDLGNGFNNWMYLSAGDWDKIHELDGLTGYAFDKAYIAEQVRLHASLLRDIGAQMDRGTTNSSVQGWITNGQGMVQNHLEEARRISYNFDDPFHIDRPWPWIH